MIGTRASSIGLFLVFGVLGSGATEPSSDFSLMIVGAYGRQNIRKTGRKDTHLGSGSGYNGTGTTGDRVARPGG